MLNRINEYPKYEPIHRMLFCHSARLRIVQRLLAVCCAVRSLKLNSSVTLHDQYDISCKQSSHRFSASESSSFSVAVWKDFVHTLQLDMVRTVSSRNVHRFSQNAQSATSSLFLSSRGSDQYLKLHCILIRTTN